METDPHKVYKTTVVIMKRDQSSLVVVVLHLYSGGREIDFSTPLNGFFCPSAKFARISKKDPTVLKVDWDFQSRKRIQRSLRSTETLGNLSRLRPSKTAYLYSACVSAVSLKGQGQLIGSGPAIHGERKTCLRKILCWTCLVLLRLVNPISRIRMPSLWASGRRRWPRRRERRHPCGSIYKRSEVLQDIRKQPGSCCGVARGASFWRIDMVISSLSAVCWALPSPGAAWSDHSYLVSAKILCLRADSDQDRSHSSRARRSHWLLINHQYKASLTSNVKTIL
jgi:hypothetical protein